MKFNVKYKTIIVLETKSIQDLELAKTILNFITKA